MVVQIFAIPAVYLEILQLVQNVVGIELLMEVNVFVIQKVT
jgi:hypothetical protein